MSSDGGKDLLRKDAAVQAATQAETGQLADAAMALLRCESTGDVYAVIGEFISEVVPGAIVIVNEAAPDLDRFVTRAVSGLDESDLVNAGKLVGFDVVGKQSPISTRLRTALLDGHLSRIEGGFAEFAESEIPHSVGAAGAKMFGICDVYTIGVSDSSTTFGNVHILTRSLDTRVPAELIETFAHHCFSALANVRRAEELGRVAQRNALVLRNMVEGLAMHEIILDDDGKPCDYRFLEVNPAWEVQTGLRAEDIIGRTVLEVLPGTEQHWIDRYGAVAVTGVPTRFEEYARELDRYYLITAYSPQPGQFVSVGTDVTERRKSEETLRESEERYRLLTESIRDVIWTLDPETLRFLYVSPSVEKLRGFTPEEVLAAPVDAALDPEMRQRVRKLIVEGIEAMDAGRIAADQFITQEIQQPCKDGSTIMTEVVASLHINERTGRREVRGVTRDITERKHLEAELQRQATTDDLTGVANRRHFLELATSELRRAHRYHHPLAVAYMDVDHLKRVNDLHGHAAGDQMLITFVEAAQATIREVDVLARVGGDEFALILPATDCSQAGATIERLREMLAHAPAHSGGTELSITVSAGIACSCDQDEGLDALLSRADRALYQAKESGRDRSVIADSTP